MTVLSGDANGSGFYLSLNLDHKFLDFIIEQRLKQRNDLLSSSQSCEESVASEECLVVNRMMDKCFGSLSIEVTTVPRYDQARMRCEDEQMSGEENNLLLNSAALNQTNLNQLGCFSEENNVYGHNSMLGLDNIDVSSVEKGFHVEETSTGSESEEHNILPGTIPNPVKHSAVNDSEEISYRVSNVTSLHSSSSLSALNAAQNMHHLNLGDQTINDGSATTTVLTTNDGLMIVNSNRMNEGVDVKPIIIAMPPTDGTAAATVVTPQNCNTSSASPKRATTVSRCSNPNQSWNTFRKRGRVHGSTIQSSHLPNESLAQTSHSNPPSKQPKCSNKVQDFSLRPRLFKCMLCNFTTPYNSSLDVHTKSIHSVERPFSCALCEYTCKLKGNLKKHYMGIHKLESEPASLLLKHSISKAAASRERDRIGATNDKNDTSAASAKIKPDIKSEFPENKTVDGAIMNSTEGFNYFTSSEGSTNNDTSSKSNCNNLSSAYSLTNISLNDSVSCVVNEVNSSASVPLPDCVVSSSSESTTYLDISSYTVPHQVAPPPSLTNQLQQTSHPPESPSVTYFDQNLHSPSSLPTSSSYPSDSNQHPGSSSSHYSTINSIDCLFDSEGDGTRTSQHHL